MSLESIYEQLDELYNTGKIDKIEQFLLKTLEETDEANPDYVSVLNELAGYYRGVSRYDESAAAFEKAIEILRRQDASATSAFAALVLNYAGLRRMMGEVEAAIELFLQAKSLCEQVEPRDEYIYVSAVNNLALAYQDMGDFDNAFECANESLTLTRARSGESDEHEIATALNNLAAIRLQQKNYEAAEQYIAESLAIYDAMEQKNVHHAAALATCATIMFYKEDFANSRAMYLRSAEMTRENYGENADFATTMRNIAAVDETLGDLTAALIHMTTAYTAAQRIFGQAHARTIEYQQYLSELQAARDAK